MIIKSIDLWNDHKPSQSIDAFLVDYFDKDSKTFAYDKILICPNLIGNYQVIHPQIGELGESMCPSFNGGLIFLKNNVPIRLFLCHSNEIVERKIGHKYGVDDIFETLRSDELIEDTGLTLMELLKRKENNVEIFIDENVKSKYTSDEGYVPKNDVAFESADSMKILTGPTFLDSVENWEAITYNPDLIFRVGVVAQEFEIEIEHKGYLVGVKKNIDKLVDDVKGRKLYGIALQTAKEDEYLKMTKFAEEFSQKVGEKVSQETLDLGMNINKALLDREL